MKNSWEKQQDGVIFKKIGIWDTLGFISPDKKHGKREERKCSEGSHQNSKKFWKTLKKSFKTKVQLMTS